MNNFWILFISLIGTSAISQKVNSVGSVDFISANGNLNFNYKNKEVSGNAQYVIQLKNKVDTLYLDAISMTISKVQLNGKQVEFANSGKQLKIFNGLKKGKNDLSFDYSANPKQALYFVQAPDHYQIWTQGQGKYTSHWFPSLDDVNDKMIFGLTINYDSNYTVVSNGKLIKTSVNNQNKQWQFQMDQPMSSYLLMLTIGKFDHKTIQANSGIVSELYIEPQEIAKKFEPTYRYSKEIFDFLEKELTPYPWGIYRQIPVRDFLYGGMENTTATLFTRDYVVDEIGYNDRNYVNVNAHELAHQWFGDCITATSGTHHWLQEGFATYYALLAEEAVFGEDYFYWKLYENAEMLQRVTNSDTIPMMNPKASSLTFYQKGAWALHDLRSEVGPENFRIAVRNYLQKYAFQNVDTDQFLDEVAAVAYFDRPRFRANWLLNHKFPIFRSMDLLKENAMISRYLEVLDKVIQDFDLHQDFLLEVMKSDSYYPIKQAIIEYTTDLDFEKKKKILEAGMKTNDIEVRQSIARSFRKKIPEDFRKSYETLLKDASYITQEIALNALTRDFPEHRHRYLNELQNVEGLNDKNVRLLWLTLALKTQDYQTANKTKYYDELLSYAAEGQEASIRQNALQKLLFLNAGDTNVLPLLSKALVHHKWQLTKYARDTIRQKLKLQNHQEFYKNLLPKLSGEEHAQLKRLLDEL